MYKNKFVTKSAMILPFMLLCVTSVLTSCNLDEQAASIESRDRLKVAFVYSNPVQDLGWVYQHELARAELQNVFKDKIDITYAENIQDGPDAARVMRQYAQSGYDIIFATSFGYMDSILDLAREFPQVKFEHCSGYKTESNVSTYFGRMYQPRYLSGMVAGMMTKSNMVGFVAPFPIPEVVRDINAFTLGVTTVNPEAKVYVVWTSTWYDPVLEHEAADALLDRGVDVMAQHQDTLEPQKVAAERGAMSIGYHSDMGRFVGKSVLCSSVWNWSPYYIETVQNALNDTWVSHQYWGGMREGVVALSDLSPLVPEEVSKAVSIKKAQIMNDEWDVFCGPINNQEGKKVVPAGTCVSDIDLLNFDWFVQGVVADMP